MDALFNLLILLSVLLAVFAVGAYLGDRIEALGNWIAGEIRWRRIVRRGLTPWE